MSSVSRPAALNRLSPTRLITAVMLLSFFTMVSGSDRPGDLVGFEIQDKPTFSQVQARKSASRWTVKTWKFLKGIFAFLMIACFVMVLCAPGWFQASSDAKFMTGWGHAFLASFFLGTIIFAAMFIYGLHKEQKAKIAGGTEYYAWHNERSTTGRHLRTQIYFVWVIVFIFMLLGCLSGHLRSVIPESVYTNLHNCGYVGLFAGIIWYIGGPEIIRCLNKQHRNLSQGRRLYEDSVETSSVLTVCGITLLGIASYLIYKRRAVHNALRATHETRLHL